MEEKKMVEETKVEENVETDELPAGEGENQVEEPEKKEDRPEKNWQAELDRKVGERDSKIEELEDKIAELSDKSSEPKKEGLREKLVEAGYDEILAKALEGIQNEIADIKSSQKDVSKQAYTSSRETHLSSIKGTDKTGLVAKYESEINEVLDKTDPELWGSKEAIRRISKMVIGEHIEELLSEKSSAESSPTEDSPASSSGKKTGKVDKDIREYADMHGLNVNNPEVRKTIIKTMELKKKLGG